jgi:hypothetical protein
MEADLHNLVPAVGELNGDRSNLPFGIVPGPGGAYGACDFKIGGKPRAVQPRPEVRGDAARILQAAEAYRERVVFEATGQADRFVKIYEEYAKAPDVTRRRMYLETMERVFDGMDKVIVDPGAAKNGGGVVPYLPLNELQRRRPAAAERPSASRGA